MEFSSSPELRGILEDAGMAYVNRAKASAPISKNPTPGGLVNGGALRASIGYAVNFFGTPMVNVTISAGGPMAPYAPAVEFGSASSMRMAVNRQVMFWMEDGAGRKVQNPFMQGAFSPGVAAGMGWNAKYRHIVWHPGTRPQPFFFRHAPEITARAMAAMAAAIRRIMNQ